MKVGQLTWRCLLGILLTFLALLHLAGAGMAQQAVAVQLDAVGAPGVVGTATLVAAGDGTHVTLDIKGMAPGDQSPGFETAPAKAG